MLAIIGKGRLLTLYCSIYRPCHLATTTTPSKVDATTFLHQDFPFHQPFSQVLFSIPPQKNLNDYLTLVNEALTITASYHLFISSTGDYLGRCEMEALVLKSPTGAVLRLGGLLGLSKHPVFYLSGKQNIARGDDPVRLIHAFDAATKIHQMMNQPQNSLSELFHPLGLTRRVYYTDMAIKLGIPIPHFS